MMKLTSMKIDAKTMQERNAPSPSLVEGPVYPYGLQVRLDNDSLEKLGLETLPKVDSYMILTARVCVTSVSSNEYKSSGDADTQQNRSVELQIEAMNLAAAPKDEDASDQLYGKEK